MKRIALAVLAAGGSMLFHAAFASGVDELSPSERLDAAKTVQSVVEELQNGMAVVGDVGDMSQFSGHNSIFIGLGAGASATTGSRDILVGNCTALPTPETSDFVNIGNKLCFWRDTGAKAVCPPPEKGCTP